MDGSTLLQLRNLLLSRRSRATTLLRQDIGSDDQMLPQAEIIDMAQTIEQIDRDRSLAEQGKRDSDAIERALAKLATGTFGMCEDCDEDIPVKRLLAVPEARLCTRCQTFEERQQGRHRGYLTAVSR